MAVQEFFEFDGERPIVIAERTIVDLRDVRQSWVAVNRAKVESFKSDLRTGIAPVDPLWVRLLDDGGMEIIDGTHRSVALAESNVPRWEARVITCSDSYADRWRAKLSLDHPAEVVEQRALQAIRESFGRDIRRLVADATLYERVPDNEGHDVIQPRAGDLPTDPLMALLAVIHHMAVAPANDTEWADAVEHWLDTQCAFFNRDRRWLERSVLGLHVLLGDAADTKENQKRADLLTSIPYADIQRIVVKKLRREPRVSADMLRKALNFVGCGPDSDKVAWCKPRPGRYEMVRRLERPWDMLVVRYDDTMRDYMREQERRAKPPIVEPAKPPQPMNEPIPFRQPPIPPVAPPTTQAVPLVAPENIVDRVSPTWIKPQQPAQPTATYSTAHEALQHYLAACADYEHRGGDWSDKRIVDDLAVLAAHLEIWQRHICEANGGA